MYLVFVCERDTIFLWKVYEKSLSKMGKGLDFRAELPTIKHF